MKKYSVFAGLIFIAFISTTYFNITLRSIEQPENTKLILFGQLILYAHALKGLNLNKQVSDELFIFKGAF